MTKKCDFDGCANNVNWKVRYRYYTWKKKLLCKKHMELFVLREIKDELFEEIRVEVL